jgi:hypothetical protein
MPTLVPNLLGQGALRQPRIHCRDSPGQVPCGQHLLAGACCGSLLRHCHLAERARRGRVYQTDAVGVGAMERTRPHPFPVAGVALQAGSFTRADGAGCCAG